MKTIFLLVITTLFWACSGIQNLQNQGGGESVKMSHPLVQSVQKGDAAAGVQNLRFRFAQEFVLTLADSAGNGVRKVTPQGNVILLSETTVRFPTNKLGKFVVGDQNMLMLDRVFKITFEDDNNMYVPELGTPELRAQYDSLGIMRVVEDFFFNGKPAVKYQNAIYFLPSNYKTFDLLVGQEGKGRQKIVRGVKTPAEENRGQ